MNQEKKPCTACKKILPKTPEFFFRDITRKDGFDHRCKKCASLSKNKSHKADEAAHSTKKCLMCERHLPATAEYFGRSSRSSSKNPHGLYSYCKPCSRERNRAWRAKNKEFNKAATVIDAAPPIDVKHPPNPVVSWFKWFIWGVEDGAA